MRLGWIAAAIIVGACATASGDNGRPLSPAALMSHIEVLASDEFEGRAPGTRGEELTIQYITEQFYAAGLQPGVNGSWVQEVPMATAEVANNPTLRIGNSNYNYGTDFVAWTKSPAFAEAHNRRPPKEMFAGPNKLEIHEVFLSTDLEV